MNTLPIIQMFFEKPVRFFKAEFTPELYPRSGDTGYPKTLLETWAIPLPDYCVAIGYPVKKIFDMIQRNKDVFEGFYKHETILDRFGRQQRNTILKKSPTTKGTTKHPDERQKTLAYKNEHPKAGGKEIKGKLGLTVSGNTVNTWVRLRVA